MATSYAEVILQVFDDYGVILAGGTIDTYEAGTTTPLATYQDLAGSTANTNPVVLNAAGRAIVRLTNGVAYKFVIKDSDGNTIVTLDDIIVGVADSATTEVYAVHMSYLGTPAANALIGAWILEDAVTFPANFTGSPLTARASVQGNPTAEHTVIIEVGGSGLGTGTEVGAIVIATDGNCTFTTTGAAAWSGVKYDQINAYADAYDATLADICILLLASVDSE